MIARLLHMANSSPPMDRKEFYALKQRILEKRGTRDGFDVQHIAGKRCFGCDGTGIYDEERGHLCYKCDGSGWWKRPKWVVLERFTFGGYRFHIPRETSYTKPEPDTTRIDGYIEHKSYGRKSDTAYGWLCLLTGNFRMFWRWVKSSRPCGWHVHPLLVAQIVVVEARMKISDWRQRCRCGRHTWGSGTFVCKRCSETTEEVPF